MTRLRDRSRPTCGSMPIGSRVSKGFEVDRIGRLRWLVDVEITYWGDVDTHGFAILDRLRAWLPQTRSALMDRENLLAHRDRWGREKSPSRALLTRLTPRSAISTRTSSQAPSASGFVSSRSASTGAGCRIGWPRSTRIVPAVKSSDVRGRQPAPSACGRLWSGLFLPGLQCSHACGVASAGKWPGSLPARGGHLPHSPGR